MTEAKIAQSRMRAGDRVKVVSGTYISLIGEIKVVKEKEVVVYFRSQGITEDIPQENLRIDFEIGDQVRVLDGGHQGLVGWVTEISSDKIHVSNAETQIEVGGSHCMVFEAQINLHSQVNVAKSHVEFYSLEQGISLRPRVGHPKWANLGDQNPNDVFKSMRVVVIGNHEWKGYKGFIKSTTPDGYAFLQLDTPPSEKFEGQFGPFSASVSMLHTIFDIPIVYLPRRTHEDEHCNRLVHKGSPKPSTPAQSSSSTPNSDSVELPAGTPTWDPAESSHLLSPAWNPSPQSSPRHIPDVRDSNDLSEFSPRTDALSHPNHWLNNQKLHDLRLKLTTSDPSVQSPYVELLGVEKGLVKVRDKLDVRFLTFEVVRPLLPASKGDLVIPIESRMQGIYFSVVSDCRGYLCGATARNQTDQTKSRH